MSCRPIERANRAVLRALETPPDTGREPRLDAVAARLHRLARESGSEPDPGCLERLQYALEGLADGAHHRRARELRAASRHLDQFRRRMDPI